MGDLENNTIKRDKFILYLPKSYFNSSCCGRCNNMIIEDLEKSGIEVYSLNNIQWDNFYDDLEVPEVNVLYIWLSDNKYYNDRIYSEKKTELEREILFLLTGILGGQTISCNTYLRTDDTIDIKQDTDAGLVNESVQLKEISSHSKSVEKDEIYGNTGSPILLESKDWTDLKLNIMDYFSKIDNKTIISYSYFMNNSDLLLFAFKRFKLKLNNYNYKIIEDKTCEKSVQVRTALKKWGLNVNVDLKNKYSKLHHYNIEFHSVEELKIINDVNELEKKKREDRDTDIFARLRYEYELNNIIVRKQDPNWGGDEKPIYIEVVKYAKRLEIYDKLVEWINKNNSGVFNGICHTFKSKADIDYWFEQNLNVTIE